MTGHFVTYRSYLRDRMARVWNEGGATAPRTVLLDGALAVVYETGPETQHTPIVGERVLLPLADNWDLLAYILSDDCPGWDAVEPREKYRWGSQEQYNADLLRQLEIALDYGAPILRTVTPEMAVQRGWATPEEELPVARRPVEARDGELLPSSGETHG